MEADGNGKAELCFWLSGKYFFKNQSGRDPKGCIIQPDDTVDIGLGLAVVPGTDAVLFQEGTA